MRTTLLRLTLVSATLACSLAHAGDMPKHFSPWREAQRPKLPEDVQQVQKMQKLNSELKKTMTPAEREQYNKQGGVGRALSAGKGGCMSDACVTERAKNNNAILEQRLANQRAAEAARQH